MKRIYTKEQELQVVELYTQNKSTVVIGKQLGIKIPSVRAILLRNGVKLKTHSEAIYLNSKLSKEESLKRNKISKGIRHLQESSFWKAKCLVRDNFTCQKCGFYNIPDKPHISIHVDHIIPFYTLMDKYNIQSIQQARECAEFWDENNGRCLCSKCHKEDTDYAWRRE